MSFAFFETLTLKFCTKERGLQNHFDGNQYRISRINEAVRLIYQINNELGEIKNRKDYDVSCLSGRGSPDKNRTCIKSLGNFYSIH